MENHYTVADAIIALDALPKDLRVYTHLGQCVTSATQYNDCVALDRLFYDDLEMAITVGDLLNLLQDLPVLQPLVLKGNSGRKITNILQHIGRAIVLSDIKLKY